MDTKFRLALAASMALFPLVPLVWRLGQLQIVEHRSLENKASGEFSRTAQIVVPRGDILDREGNILAQSMPVWTVFIDKRMVPRVDAVAAKLAPLLKLSVGEIGRRYRAGTRNAVLRRDLSFEESQALAGARIEGIGIEPGEQRFYPNGDLGRSVLGQVSKDGRGVAGVELALETRLAGKPRKLRLIRDGAGKSIYKSLEEEEPAPSALRLTLDRNIQFIAEEALAEAAQKFSATQGIAAIQDPTTGDILAMAVHPANPLKNPIIQDTYEPGSTFKAVTMAAALEDGVASENDQFFCENGNWQIAPGTTIHDHEPAGALSVREILEQSSNIGTAKIAEKLGAARFYRYARAFGFASRTAVALPGETSGEMRPLVETTRVGLAAASYGYGVAVSALQVLGAYSAVANGGTLYEPRIVVDGNKPVKVRRVASAKTMERLTKMLEGVVDRGTAETARISGYRVAGKTGTARRLDPTTKKYSQSLYNASFVGFLPASAPKWTILVVLENPRGSYYGAQTSAPVFARIGKQLLALKGVAPDKTPSVSVATVPAPGRPIAAPPVRAR